MYTSQRHAAHAFRLASGADLRAELVARTQAMHIGAAAIVTCVGSLQVASLRLADESLPKPYVGPFEIVSLVGTLGQGLCHLHLSIADATGRVIGGHMREGCIVHTTAEIVLVSLADLIFDRQPDAGTGFNELAISAAVRP